MPPRPFQRFSRRFARAVLTAALCGVLHAEETPTLRIAFGNGVATIEGQIPSRESLDALVATVAEVRPDLVPSTDKLSIDGATDLPDVHEWRSLLSELALSTHEGRLEIWPDRLVFGGLTDSPVILSALRIQAEPLLAGRVVHNRLCIVGTEDLPRIEISLADGRKIDGTPTPAETPKVNTPYEGPGVRLEKLLATLRMIGSIDQLAGRPAPATPTSGTRSLRAEPLAMIPGSPPETTPGSSPAVLPELPPGPTIEALPPILFSRNAFLLQFNQVANLDALAQHLLSPARRGAVIRIEAVKPRGGSTAYNDYLCERRATEVTKLLTERGVDSSLLAVKAVESDSTVDGGEVRISVEIPPPPAPPVEALARPEAPETTVPTRLP